MLWNVWVLLALPAIWLAWSMIAFVVSILSFVWRTGSTDDPSDDGPNPRALSPRQALGPRLAITCTLALGLIYFAMVIHTFQSYGQSGRRTGPVKLSANSTRGAHAEPDAERGEMDSEDEVRERGREKERRSEGQSSKGTLGLGLTGMDQKMESNGVGKTPVNVVEEKAPSASVSSFGM